MKKSTRAFFILALIALPGAAALQLLAVVGMPGAWTAMVHLSLFGWITSMILGVSYHTMPVFSARDFPFPRLIWTHVATLSTGLVLATTGILSSWNLAATVGLLLQLAGASLFVANTLLLFTKGQRRPHGPPIPPIEGQPLVDRIGTRATKLSALSLPLALLLLLISRLGWINSTWVLAAEHLATLGWLMLMITGVAYHVLPRFSGAATRGPTWACMQQLCHTSALVLIVLSLGFGWTSIFTFGGLLMTLALGLFAWTIWPTLRPFRPAPASIPLIVKEQPR